MNTVLDANEGCFNVGRKLETFTAKDRPSVLVSSITKDMEGSAFMASSLPELKRASSVPVGVTLPSGKRSISSGKQSFKIQLPSFDLFWTPPFTRGSYTAPVKSLSIPEQHSEVNGARSSSPGSIVGGRLPVHIGFAPLLTPPDDSTFNSHKVTTSSVKAHSRDTPFLSSNQNVESIHPNVQEVTSNQPVATTFIPEVAPSMPEVPMPEVNSEGAKDIKTSPNLSSQDVSGTSSWLDSAISATLSELSAHRNPREAVRILSHALPCPALEIDGETTKTAFTTLIMAIQAQFQSQPSPAISVVHAVPSRFPLANLPTSPPSTPNSSMIANIDNNLEDYFNLGVFSSAVPVTNHHESFGRAAENTPVPSSPSLAVPPSSIGLALLERIIPPSSVQEYLDLFAPTGPSALVNRLVELSPNRGTMLFIHPTKEGATTFTSRYLGPILDPVLRTMINSHNLSADIAFDLGKMDAVEHLSSFEVMKRKINTLLGKLNRGNSSSRGMSYSLIYSSKEKVHVERRVWTDWFVQQETSRFRHVTTRYFQRARRLPDQPHVNYAVLTREIVEGLAERKYKPGEEPGSSDRIEVGVYVIRRNA